MNTCTFTGFLGKDPEMRYTPQGKAVTNFNLAVKSKGEDTLWVKCTAWEKIAEVTAQYLRKGSQVLVSGPISVETWQTKDGEPRSTMVLTVREFEFLDRKRDGGEALEGKGDEEELVLFQE